MEKVLLSELSHVVRKVIARVPQEGERAALITLHGDLGAGKTTFVQALGRELGVTEVIQSPTYVLMKSYPITPPAGGGRFTKLVHIDAYRLNTPMEFASLQPEEFLRDPHSLVVLEWPEKVEGQLPKADVILNFSSDEALPGERFINIEPRPEDGPNRKG